MIYFKKTYILSAIEKKELETELRNKSLKRSQSLDFVFETTNTGTDKYFLGNEGKKELKFIRIKTSFESFLPKIIVSFPKETDTQYYKFRLSFLSTVIFLILAIFLITSFLSLVINQMNSEAFLIFTTLFIIYFLLILFELKITQLKIIKSVSKTVI